MPAPSRLTREAERRARLRDQADLGLARQEQHKTQRHSVYVTLAVGLLSAAVVLAGSAIRSGAAVEAASDSNEAEAASDIRSEKKAAYADVYAAFVAFEEQASGSQPPYTLGDAPDEEELAKYKAFERVLDQVRRSYVPKMAVLSLVGSSKMDKMARTVDMHARHVAGDAGILGETLTEPGARERLLGSYSEAIGELRLAMQQYLEQARAEILPTA